MTFNVKTMPNPPKKGNIQSAPDGTLIAYGDTPINLYGTNHNDGGSGGVTSGASGGATDGTKKPTTPARTTPFTPTLADDSIIFSALEDAYQAGPGQSNAFKGVKHRRPGRPTLIQGKY